MLARLLLLLTAVHISGARRESAASRFWSERAAIEAAATLAPSNASSFVWSPQAARLYRKLPSGLVATLRDEGHLRSLLAPLVCGGDAPADALAARRVLKQSWWPVELGHVRRLIASGTVCRPPALEPALAAYRLRHAAAVGTPTDKRGRFLVYQICCGGLGNRLQSLVASFALALLTDRTFLVSWPKVEGGNNETWRDVLQPAKLPGGELGWDAETLFARVPAAQIEGSRRILPLHHGQMQHGWSELLCADLNAAWPEQWVFVESNQYFAPALLANGHYAEPARQLFGSGAGRGVFASLAPFVLRPISGIQGAVDSFVLEKMSRKVGLTVGLQMRTKDRHPLSERHIQRMLAWAAAQVESVNRTSRKGGARAKVFLATDNVALRKRARAALSDALLYFDRPVALSVAGVVDAVVDLLLLARCDRIMLSSGSTFGYVAMGHAGKVPWLLDAEARPYREAGALPTEPCLHVWPFLRFARCWHSEKHEPLFARKLCHPFDAELQQQISAQQAAGAAARPWDPGRAVKEVLSGNQLPNGEKVRGTE